MGNLQITLILGNVAGSDIEDIKTAINSFISNSGFNEEHKTIKWEE